MARHSLGLDIALCILQKLTLLGLFFTINLLCFMGNVQVNWPKLFQVFSVTFTYACVHSIIPHQHV